MKKIGFIGCGEWARKKYLPFLKKLSPDIEVVAASNIIHNEEKKLIQSEIPNCVFFDRAENMLSSVPLDAVVITLPHALHFDAVKQCIQHSIPCLVDKPLCPTFAKAQELVHLANKNGVSIAICNQRRAQGGNKQIKELIGKNRMGKLLWLEGKFLISSYPNWEKTWRNQPHLSGDEKSRQGLILDTGYHTIDAILYMLDYKLPERVFASASNRTYEVDVDSSIIMEFSNGFRVTLTFSRGLPQRNNIEEISVLGTDGFAVSKIIEQNGVKSATITLNSKSKVVSENIALDFPLEPLKDFLNYIKGGRLPEFWMAESTLPTMRVIGAIYESIQNGEIVSL